MKRYLKRAHRAAYIGSVGFFFAVFYPFLYFFSRKHERFTLLNHLRRLYAFLSSALVGFFYRYEIRGKLDRNRNYIFCANHSSNLDITAMSLMISRNFAFLGKEELLNNPVTGLWFKTIDIPVDRNSRISAFKAFKRAEEYLKSGFSVVIFPEGRIADVYPPELHEFKNGPFRLAIENNVPIVPVTIRDAWKKVWDDGSKYGSSPGICHICVHDPIETQHLGTEDTEKLKAEVFRIIDSEFKKHETR